MLRTILQNELQGSFEDILCLPPPTNTEPKLLRKPHKRKNKVLSHRLSPASLKGSICLCFETRIMCHLRSAVWITSLSHQEIFLQEQGAPLNIHTADRWEGLH